MKLNLRKHIVTCALIAGIGAAAYAQTAPTTPPAAPQGKHQRFDPAKRAEFQAKRAEMRAKRLADLKQKLQIQGNQESAWTSYTTALQSKPTMQRPSREALANMSTPDRLDQMRALREQRNAEMDRRAEATKAFYAQLTSEQKKTFDTETQRRFGHGGHGGRHHRHQG
jgi:hypothetical protein